LSTVHYEEFPFISVLSLVLLGCTTVTPVSTAKYPPVSADKVEVLYEQPQRPHEVIGLVNYSGHGGLLFMEDSAHLIQHCKESAGQLGADAVIVNELAEGGAYRRPTASGIAIKWK
jgi:hypothetical protein